MTLKKFIYFTDEGKLININQIIKTNKSDDSFEGYCLIMSNNDNVWMTNLEYINFQKALVKEGIVINSENYVIGELKK